MFFCFYDFRFCDKMSVHLLLAVMWKFIEKLRTLPESSRKAVALFSSAGITAVILLSWLVFPVPHFGSLTADEEERKNAESLIAPFSVVGEQLHAAIGSVKNEWSSFGGTAGILSSVSALKENLAAGNATSAPNAVSDNLPASSTNETVAKTISPL